MRDLDERGGRVLYIGPRSFVIGFALFCAAFIALIYGVDRFTMSLDTTAASPAAGDVSLMPAPTSVADSNAIPVPQTAVPVKPAVRARAVFPATAAVVVPRAASAFAAEHVGAAVAGTPAVAQRVQVGAGDRGARSIRVPEVLRRGVTVRATTVVVRARPVVRVAPLPSRAQPAAPSAPLIRGNAPIARTVVREPEPRSASATPLPVRRAQIKPQHAAASSLLVPFASAASITPNGGIDPRTGPHAALGVENAAPPSAP